MEAVPRYKVLVLEGTVLCQPFVPDVGCARYRLM